jgi:uncharacterized protein GlcG (DUF336 family)
MIDLTLAMAETAVRAAQARAAALRSPMTTTVVDEAGRLVGKGGFWSSISTILQGQALPTLGASPIVRAGRVIGAIGCGGGTGEQDQECADAGAAAVASS